MSKHDEAARRIARRRGTNYNKGQGPDVETSQIAIEVETEGTVGDAGRQLSGFQKPVYVAGATAKATRLAIERYNESTIGVMNPQGRIVKRSTRRRR